MFDRGLEVKFYDNFGLRVSVGNEEQNNYFLKVIQDLSNK
ncbi:protein of unknown function [Xenorhabdus nematophila AN6/1]|nr:hypothetical protein XNW1_4110001 [Xenorhabdus nematophila str. Websteri]CEK21707.1 protein of unknown function [Xenorhabdus nematophila AN6/1]